MLTNNENIGEHSIYNFSTNFLWGREIAQAVGKIFCQKFRRKFRQNFGKIL